MREPEDSTQGLAGSLIANLEDLQNLGVVEKAGVEIDIDIVAGAVIEAVKKSSDFGEVVAAADFGAVEEQAD